MDLPSNRDINKQRVARFHESITAGLSHKDLGTFQSIINQYQRDNDVPIELIAASLAVLTNGNTAVLAKDDFKQARFSSGSERGGGGGDYRAKSPNGKARFDRNGSGKRSAGRMETYRIAVGKNHQVQPGNIVGAIANEAGIGNESIGKIKIFDQYSTVDLPAGLAQGLIETLKNVVVSGRKLGMTRIENSKPRPAHFQYGKRPFNKSKAKSKSRKRASTAK
jgi:ATP-dependent RNA helicase DeaD